MILRADASARVIIQLVEGEIEVPVGSPEEKMLSAALRDGREAPFLQEYGHPEMIRICSVAKIERNGLAIAIFEIRGVP